ncbi:hypothetical protein K1719_018844 [Acacia pycnantha]|nr:hypothetical protein K1719_018844 [Acacia pycnantha]
MVGDFFPWLGWVYFLSGKIKELKDTFKAVDGLFDEVAEDHKKVMKKKTKDDDEKKDFVDIILQLQETDKLAFELTKDDLKAIVHGEQRGMGYGLHLPRTSQVGNQVHQDDPVNEGIRDAFGVRDDNFTVEVRGPNLFSSGMMRLGNFSASWMRAIVLCIKVVINTQSYLFDQIVPYQVHVWDHDKAMSMFWNYFEMHSRRGHSPSFYEAKKIIND